MLNDLWNQILTMLENFVPSLVGAVALLVIGWLVARGLSALVKKALHKTTLDTRIAQSLTGKESVRTEPVVGRVVFWLVMILVIIGVLQILGLTLATGPLDEMMTRVFEFIPRLAAAGILFIAAWIVATLLRIFVRKGLEAVGLDRRLSDRTGDPEAGRMSVSHALAEAVYWLVFLFFLPAVLEALALSGLMAPIQDMLTEITGFLPNLITAGIVLLVGWFLARVLQRIVKGVLAAMGADSLADRVGIGSALGAQGLSGLLSMIAYVLVLVPVLIAALNALSLEPITQPASNMLNMVLTAIPAILAAVILLGLAYAVGSFLSRLISQVLAGSGFDALIQRIGWTPGGEGRASTLVGTLILVAVMLFAGIESLRLVNFDAAANLVSEFLVFAGHVALGLVIFAVGMFVANVAARTIREGGSSQAALLATAARASILVLAAAMGLREMGVGEDIVRLAFGLLVGAVAVALAVAFGIGGRNVAQRKLEQWTEDIEGQGKR